MLNKILIFSVLAFLASPLLANEACDIDVYIPAIEYSDVLTEQEVVDSLELKGYNNVQFISIINDSNASYLLSFDESGIFPIGFKASMLLSTNTHRGEIVFRRERRTFGRDQFIYFKKLLKSVPKCF